MIRNIVVALMVLMFLPFVVNATESGNVAPTSRKRVVVLDPGHGAPRPGKTMNGVREADLVLDISKEVRRLLRSEMPSLEVYLTRSCDSAYHKEQNVDNRMRAEFANSKGADLTVGIHANALQKESVGGCEVWVLSLDNNLMQQNQNRANLYVDDGDFIDAKDIDPNSIGYLMALSRQLDNEPRNRSFASDCCSRLSKLGLTNLGVKSGKIWTMLYYLEGPGALVEVGYLTNKQDFAYITSDKGKREISRAIADAIKGFIHGLDAVADTSSQIEAAEEKPAEGSAITAEQLSEGYAIQLISSTTEVDVNDSQFKEYRGRVRLLMGTGRYKYKYCYGSYTTVAEAREDLAAVRKRFKDAYVVRYGNGKILAM